MKKGEVSFTVNGFSKGVAFQSNNLKQGEFFLTSSIGHKHITHTLVDNSASDLFATYMVCREYMRLIN